MAHNYRVINTSGYNGSYYGKAGPVSGANGSADTPYPDCQNMNMDAWYNMLGTGNYHFSWYWGNNYSPSWVVGDGRVILEPQPDGQKPGQMWLTRSGDATHNFVKIILQNYDAIVVQCFDNVTDGAGLSFQTCILKLNNTSNNFYSRALENSDKRDVRVRAYITDSIVYNLNSNVNTYMRVGASRSLFFNCSLVVAQYAYNCYFDQGTTLAAFWGPDSYQNNNIRGKVQVGLTVYPTVQEAIAAGAIHPSNFSADPGFNRPAAEDYTLKISSKHLDIGVGPSHLRYALMYYIEFSGSVGEPCTPQNTKLRSTADGSFVNFLEINGFTVNEQGGLVIMPNSSGNYEGNYTTDRIRVAATGQPIELLPVVFAANYDTDYPTVEAAFSAQTPELRNNNVPARQNFTSGAAGRNPHRLTVQARFSPNLSPDVNTSGDWTGGIWYDFELDSKPTYNASTGLGNGHPSYDQTPASVSQVEARWLQLRYRARNNFYSR